MGQAMKSPRTATAFVVFVLAAVAALSFLYAAPSGRRVRREILRAVRLARNATGIYPQPVLTVTMWSGTPPVVVLVEVYESGRLVVSDRGKQVERQLSPDAAERLIESGKAALGDFSQHACGTKRGGVNSALYVLIDGAWTGSVCRDASDRPDGFKTKRLLTEIESHVAGVFARF
jgi:hypothetical protein